jgi:hypothetical protein
MPSSLIPATAAILTAVLAAVLSYAYGQRLQRRKARLDRLNAQLEQLYGPLYATLEASRMAYRNSWKRCGPVAPVSSMSRRRPRNNCDCSDSGWKRCPIRALSTPSS